MALHDLTAVPDTDPIEIYRLRDGFYATDLVAAALVHFDFFSWLARRPADLPAICRELQIAPRTADVMLTLFAALGFVESGEGVFHLTPLARDYLVSSSPWFVGPYYAALKDRPVCRGNVDVVAGDMLREDWPAGCDAQLISNVLHDWDVPVVKDLLARSFRALPPGGLLVIHDAHLNETKTGPVPVAKYSALLMHSTEGRCYSVAEIGAWLEAAGFGEMQFKPTAADRSVVT